MLIFVFLPSKLEGIDPPSSSRAVPWTSVVAALVYGSQHLRFRGEWLLCMVFGLGLAGLCARFSGSLISLSTAAVLFAVFRHWMRTGSDVRRAHKQ